jgi:hypothetical protein
MKKLKLKLIVGASNALLNTLLASSLVAVNLAPDVNPGDSGAGLLGFNSNPPLQTADLRKRRKIWTPEVKKC